MRQIITERTLLFFLLMYTVDLYHSSAEAVLEEINVYFLTMYYYRPWPCCYDNFGSLCDVYKFTIKI